MAPYCGPSLVEVIKLLKKGELPSALGVGLPRATLRCELDGVLELRGLSGGEGFGVDPAHVRPFVDNGPLVRGTWQQVAAWLCEHWVYGDPWGNRNERLRLRFAGESRALATALHRELEIALVAAQTLAKEGLEVLTVEQAAAACRAARAAGAQVDFDVIKVRVGYDVVIEDCAGSGAALYETIRERIAIGRAVGPALMRDEPVVIYTTDQEDYAQHAYDLASKVPGVRVKLVASRYGTGSQ